MKNKKENPVVPATKVKPKETSKDRRTLAAEVPIALTYNGISHVVMMTSPSDLEDFALGFSLSEELIETPSEIKS